MILSDDDVSVTLSQKIPSISSGTQLQNINIQENNTHNCTYIYLGNFGKDNFKYYCLTNKLFKTERKLLIGFTVVQTLAITLLELCQQI